MLGFSLYRKPKIESEEFDLCTTFFILCTLYSVHHYFVSKNLEDYLLLSYRNNLRDNNGKLGFSILMKFVSKDPLQDCCICPIK